MIRKILSLGVLSLACILPLQQSVAGPLTSAEVTKIINRVSVVDPERGDRSALVRDVIKDDLGLQTGEKSRSELLFQDNTLTRIGAETFFSFKTGTRDMTLEKGSMLLQVPKGLGGAKIHTAAVTAAITGTTIMMEYIPGHHIKVLVLEGSLRLSRNGTFGDSLVLRPGKMVIMPPEAKKIPDPVDVDLAHIVKTSSLVNFPDSPPLPSTALIQAAVDDQAKQIAKNNLVPTNLVMGNGTNVIVASNNQLTRLVTPPRPSVPNVNNPVGVALNAPATGPGVTSPAITAPLPITAPITGPLALNTPVISSNPVNNLIGPSGSITPLVNNLLGVNNTTTTTSISISSTTQLLGLLSNAAPAVSGTITVSPTAVNVNANVAVPVGVLPSASVNTGIVNVSTGGGTVNVTANVPLNGISLPPIVSGTVPPVTAPLGNTVNPTGLVTTVTSAPSTLIPGTVTGPGTPVTLPLGLGHH
jgi:hypothetical protein